MTYVQRITCSILLVLSCSIQAYAISYEMMNQRVSEFEESEQSRFAPASMKKIIAYQGASMLAYEEQQSSFSDTITEENQSAKLQHAIDQTIKVLEEAKNNAQTFTSTFSTLLRLETEANKAFVYHHKPQAMPEAVVSEHYNYAKQQVEVAIVSTEKGELNPAKKAVNSAQKAYNQCIETAMPGLVEQTGRALSQASRVGAERFAPRLWATTETEFELLENYSDDTQRAKDKKHGLKRPSSIGLAYEMAVFTQKMAIQVKEWRRDNGGHEKLALESRQARLAIAQALQLPLDYKKVGIDIEQSDLLQHIKTLKKELLTADTKHQTEISTLKESFSETLAQQRNGDQQIFLSKIANIKSAFNTKLEQETFENKRHKKVRALFRKNEVDIIANLDGSLMIRAKKIQFGANSSKVSGQYFDFLGRIKEALTMYPERKVKIEGHTDSTGDEKANRKLSLKRAEAVQEFLIAAGTDSERLRALGFGEVKPIASNMYKKGRAMNRRIDITVEAP